MKGSINSKPAKSNFLRIINSKAEVKAVLNELLKQNSRWDSQQTISFIHDNLLKKKVRFPVLEYFAELIFLIIPVKEQKGFLQKIIDQRCF
ncbi:MAG: hypothetical protein K0S32_4613 [Bacteroidetes bacterium]|nr:hypothetical protein [Bacteroidota bacterium]